MSVYSTIQKKLNRKVKIQDDGDTVYADLTPVGRILDRYPSQKPIKLEVWRPRLGAWEVQMNFEDWESAMPVALKERQFRSQVPPNETLRLRDSKTHDIIMVDVLVAST